MKIILYRGVKQPNLKGRVGKWWSTNPYYAFLYSNDGKNFFYCVMEKKYLNENSLDVSLEDNFDNYFFAKEDPPEIKLATHAQIKKLISYVTITPKIGKRPGGDLFKPPEDPIAVGNSIFGV